MPMARDVRVEKVESVPTDDAPRPRLYVVGSVSVPTAARTSTSAKSVEKVYVVTWTNWPTPPKFIIDDILLEANEDAGYVIPVRGVAPIYGFFERIPVSQKNGVIRYGIRVYVAS